MSSNWCVLPRDILSKVFEHSSSLSCILREVCKAWRQQSIACPLALNVSLTSPEEQESFGIWMQQHIYKATSAEADQQTATVPDSLQKIRRLQDIRRRHANQALASTVCPTSSPGWRDPPAESLLQSVGMSMTESSRNARRLHMCQQATAPTVSQIPLPASYSLILGASRQQHNQFLKKYLEARCGQTCHNNTQLQHICNRQLHPSIFLRSCC